jgi:hypothetical protein
MNRFLFITHVTPSKKRSPLREKLFSIYKSALLKQSYNNWKVLLISEENKVEGNFHHYKIDQTVSKQHTAYQLENFFESEAIMQFIYSFDYIVKLDDDDIIGVDTLERYKNIDCDLVFDEWHTFYDISSGNITQQKRNWVASTCIHKTEHALAKKNNDAAINFYNNSVLYSDHSKIWHTYYKDKNIKKADAISPLYLRVLSPTSITAGSNLDTIDYKTYYKYLKTFGYWKDKKYIYGFENYLPMLKKAWEETSNTIQKPIKGISLMNKILDRIK